MVKTCVHGLCNSNTAYANEPHMNGVKFIPFPKPLTQPEKCLRWVTACNREDFTVESVSKHSYVCSKHFHTESGPTDDFPDPVFADISQYPQSNNRTRKRLRVSPYIKQEETEVSGINEESPHGDLQAIVSPPDELQLAARTSRIDNVYLTNQVDCDTNLLHGDHQADVSPVKEVRLADRPQRRGYVDPSTQAEVDFPVSYCLEVEIHLPDEPNSQTGLSAKILYEQIVPHDLPKFWAYYFNYTDLVLVKFNHDFPVLSLTLDCQLNRILKVHGEIVNDGHELKDMLSSLRISSVRDLVEQVHLINSWTICKGAEVQSLTDDMIRGISVSDCKIVYPNVSFRSHSCQLIFLRNGKQRFCSKCSLLKRRLLAVAKRRTSKDVFGLKSRCNTRFMPIEEIRRRWKKKKDELHYCKVKIRRLQQMLKKKEFRGKIFCS